MGNNKLQRSGLTPGVNCSRRLIYRIFGASVRFVPASPSGAAWGNASGLAGRRLGLTPLYPAHELCQACAQGLEELFDGGHVIWLGPDAATKGWEYRPDRLWASLARPGVKPIAAAPGFPSFQRFHRSRMLFRSYRSSAPGHPAPPSPERWPPCPARC